MTYLIIKLIIILACGILWRLGGAAGYSKAFRRYGVPLAIAINTILMQNWYGLIAIPLGIGALHLGYGGSSKVMWFWRDLCGIQEDVAKYFTRATCGILYSASVLPILWGNWWLFGWHALALSSWVTLSGNQKFEFNDVVEEGGIGVLYSVCPTLAM